ncbi:MAG: RHS repeat protein [Bacteroidaceae bacterium]|nr:RHS repeat protein [Bacteroidaceae bacterium]
MRLHRLILLSSVILCSVLRAQNVSIPPTATERLGGHVLYYEETTYNLWSMRLTSGSQAVQEIKRPESVVCHTFNEQGLETSVTKYVQRDANVGTIGLDKDGNIDFIANEIRRDSPDTRTVNTYDGHGKLLSSLTWSYNLGDSTLVQTDSDSTGATYKYDSDNYLVRYTDSDGMTVRFYYNERGNLVKQSSEWKDGGVLNIVFEDYEYDEYGNWTRCTRKVKDPGEQPRSVKVMERTYIYR